MSARTITLALGGKWRGSQGVASCPVPEHGRGRGDRNPSLSIADGEDGALLVKCHAGCDPVAVLDALRARGLLRDATEYRRRRNAPRRPRKSFNRPSVATPSFLAGSGRDPSACGYDFYCDWERAAPPADTPVASYLLRYRRVAAPLEDVRYLHDAPYSADGRVKRPGMLALVRDPSGQPIGMQVTALRPDGMGKAGVTPPRFNFGRTAGGAVRLRPTEVGDLTGALAVAEGVESALGFTLLSGYPCWATLGASNLANFCPPPCVDELVVAADADNAGCDAAERLMRNHERQIFVEIRKPEIDGEDWADVAARRP